jgi:hypothetical protein
MKLSELFARGVQSCGGGLIYRQQHIGRVDREGGYTLNERGKALLFAEDAESKPAEPAKRGKARGIPVPPDPTPADEDDPLA